MNSALMTMSGFGQEQKILYLCVASSKKSRWPHRNPDGPMCGPRRRPTAGLLLPRRRAAH